jgi:hypothetical protein
MVENKKLFDLKTLMYLGGILTIALYLIFLIIAWGLYPNPASPLDHWLSDFGRYEVAADGGPVWRVIAGEYYIYSELFIPKMFNNGAIWYNLACILAGISMFLFFLGFLRYKDKNDTVFKVINYILLFLGFLGGIFLILIGVFSEDGILLIVIDAELSYPIHHTVTMIFFLILLIIKVFAGYWAWKLELNRLISIYCWVIIIFDIMVVATGNASSLIEWLSVLASLGLVGILDLGIYLTDLKS